MNNQQNQTTNNQAPQYTKLNREQILELKNTYLSTVVHELKNLIITINQLVIKGISDRNNFAKKSEYDSEFDCTSREKNDDEYPIYKIFHFLKGLCEYGMSLIADINTLNRGNNDIFLRKETNKNEEIKEFNITEVINLCIEMFRIRASVKEKKVKIDSEINFPYNKQIRSINESKLKQIIINLLSNSLKFTETGSIIVKAMSLPYAKKIRILVKDTGVGFDSKNFDLDKPFKLYERNEKYNEHGAGLGLYIVQNILRSYQSCLKCQSAINRGSTFYFDLNDTCPITDIVNVNKIMTNELRTMINNINLGKKDKNRSNKNNDILNQTGKIKVSYVDTEEKEHSTVTNKGLNIKEVNNKFLSLNAFKSPIINYSNYAKSPRTNNSNVLNKYYGGGSSSKNLNFPLTKKKNTCCKVVSMTKNNINEFTNGRLFKRSSKNINYNKNNNKPKNPQIKTIRKMPKSFVVNGQIPTPIKNNSHCFDSTSSDEMFTEEFNKFNNMRNQDANKNKKNLSTNGSGRKRMGSYDPSKCQKIFQQLLETRKMYQNLNKRSRRTNYTDPNSKKKKRIGETDIYYANCIGFNRGKRMNIIICDDEPPIYESEINIIKKYFKERIKEKNITPFIYYARDGIECLNMLYNFTLNNIPIKFILIDKSMTYLSGVETSNIIKGIMHFKHNHIYLVTGDNVDPGDCKADAFYPKPLTLDSFEKIMKKYI